MRYIIIFSLLLSSQLIFAPSNTQAAPFNDISKFRKTDDIAKTQNRPCHATSGNAITWSGSGTTCSGDHGNLLHGEVGTITDTTSPTGAIVIECNNGVMDPATATSSYCGNPCNLPGSLGGGTINHGDSVTAYQSSVVCGSSCASQIRTCNNGSLSGSYSQSSCRTGSWSMAGSGYIYVNFVRVISNVPGGFGPNHSVCLSRCAGTANLYAVQSYAQASGCGGGLNYNIRCGCATRGSSAVTNGGGCYGSNQQSIVHYVCN